LAARQHTHFGTRLFALLERFEPLLGRVASALWAVLAFGSSLVRRERFGRAACGSQRIAVLKLRCIAPIALQLVEVYPRQCRERLLEVTLLRMQLGKALDRAKLGRAAEGAITGDDCLLGFDRARDIVQVLLPVGAL